MQNKSVLWKYGISQNMLRGSLEVILNDLKKLSIGMHCKAVLLQAVFISFISYFLKENLHA